MDDLQPLPIHQLQEPRWRQFRCRKWLIVLLFLFVDRWSRKICCIPVFTQLFAKMFCFLDYLRWELHKYMMNDCWSWYRYIEFNQYLFENCIQLNIISSELIIYIYYISIRQRKYICVTAKEVFKEQSKIFFLFCVYFYPSTHSQIEMLYIFKSFYGKEKILWM